MYPNKYRKRVEKDLIARGVNIVFNDYVDDFESTPVKTRSGRQLEGDLVVRIFLGYKSIIIFLIAMIGIGPHVW